MKVINHCILVDCLSKDIFVLINTLTGKMFIISANEADYIAKWKTEISLADQKNNKDLIDLLLNNLLIVDSDEEEQQLVDLLVEKCRKNHNIRMSEITAVTFVLTYACNFACPYCYEGANNKLNQPIMTTEMVDKVFQIHNNIDRISLYGGEPLLPQNRNIIEYIVSRAPNAKYNITTNGYYIEEYFELIKSINIGFIMVTIDGLGNRHNMTRRLKQGGDTFNKIQNGIELCLEHKITIKIRMNISSDNKEECMEYRRLMTKKYIHAFHSGLLMFELQPIFQLEQKRRQELENELYYKPICFDNNEVKFNTMILTTSPILGPFTRKNASPAFPRFCSCDAEETARFYDAYGDVYSCILALGRSEAAIGKYYPNSQSYPQSIIERNIESIEKCKSCIKKFICGGGCALESFGMYGSFLEPNCNRINREIYEELPKLIKDRIYEQ